MLGLAEETEVRNDGINFDRVNLLITSHLIWGNQVEVYVPHRVIDLLVILTEAKA